MSIMDIQRGSGKAPVAHVTAASIKKISSASGKTVFSLTDGTVWFRAALIDKRLPAASAVGLAFTKAELAVTGTVPASAGNKIVLLAVSQLARFAAVPAKAKKPAGPLSDDGAAVKVIFPAEIVFDLAPASIKLSALKDADVTVYGQAVSLSGGPAKASYNAPLGVWIAHFADAGAASLDCGSPSSTMFATSGRPAIAAGGFVFPVSKAPAAALGFENAQGSLALILGKGLAAQWGNLADPLPFASALMLLRDGDMALAAHIAVRPFADRYDLWETPPRDAKATSLTLQGERGTLVTSLQSARADSVEVKGCAIAGHLDQPCLADGNMPAFDALSAVYTLKRGTTGKLLQIQAAPGRISGAIIPHLFKLTETYVIENALLRTGQTQLLELKARLVDGRAVEGRLRLTSKLDTLTPMLPHPYAASLTPSEPITRRLRAQVAWRDPKSPVLSFKLTTIDDAGNQQPTYEIADRESLVAIGGRERGLDLLLDVSSFGDQLGVIFFPLALDAAAIRGQILTIPGNASALYALPQISWEAVIFENDFGQRHIFPAFAEDDGPAAMVNVPTQELRPMTPAGFLEQFLADYKNGSDLAATFTLPFGLEAKVGTDDGSSLALRPRFGTVRPQFKTQHGGIQLGIEAVRDKSQPLAAIPGTSFAATETGDPDYPTEILDTPPSTPVVTFWDKQFQAGLKGQGPFVPLERIDLSGYGASTFSHFSEDVAVGVSEARFDVIVGRTAYTLIQLQSMILPWMIPVVNTTIFERDGAAWIQRRNTGWRARAAGTFAFKKKSTPVVESGGITGVYAVRNIRDTGSAQVTDKNGTLYSPMYFDADVGIASGLTIRGGDNGNGQLVGKGFIGYLDLTPSVSAPDMADVIALMDVVGSAGGPVAADIEVAKTGIRLTLTGVDVAATAPPGTRTLGVALRGLPHLPQDGSWSVAKRGATQPTPSPVDPLTPVPLVRHHSDLKTWHMAEPADVTHLDKPATLYGILQSTGTQKLFFEHATIADVAGKNPLNCVQPPKLADVGSLLGSSGLLPAIASLLDFPSFDGFAATSGGLKATNNLTKTTHIDDMTLIPLGPISVVLSTNDDPGQQPGGGAPANKSVVTAVIDPSKSPRWSVTITNVAFKLLVDGMGSSTDPLVAVIGDVFAAEGSSPTLAKVRFAYGSALSIVQQIMSGIQAIAQALPGGGASGLDVSFAGTKLRVRDAVSLPKLPLGLGYIEDISLNLGFDVDVLALDMSFYVGIGSPQTPFSWLASPLSGNGFLALGAGKALGVEMQGGIGVGLGIDLAIASGSASVVLAVRLDTTKVPFGVMVLLTGNAAVDVLDGLASASLTLTAGLGVQVSPGPKEDLLEIPPDIKDFIDKTSITLSAEVDVAIHLSVCWVVHIDWSGQWAFSETVNGSALTSLLP
jgi:hypothetical protein